MGCVQLYRSRHVTMIEEAEQYVCLSVCLSLYRWPVLCLFPSDLTYPSERERRNKEDSFDAGWMKRKCNLTTNGCTFLNSPSALSRGQGRQSRGGGGGGVHCLRTCDSQIRAD